MLEKSDKHEKWSQWKGCQFTEVVLVRCKESESDQHRETVTVDYREVYRVRVDQVTNTEKCIESE